MYKKILKFLLQQNHFSLGAIKSFLEKVNFTLPILIFLIDKFYIKIFNRNLNENIKIFY